MHHVWERGEKHTGFWRGNLSEGDHLEDGRILLKWIFERRDGGQNWDVLGNLKYCSIKILRVQVLPVDVRLSLRFCFY